MEQIASTIVILALWIFSILFPFFLTDNSKYTQSKDSKLLLKAREKTHFLKQ